MKWRPFTETEPSDSLYRMVVVYDATLDYPDCAGHPFVTSNPTFARMHAGQRGWTHWAEITHPRSDRTPHGIQVRIPRQPYDPDRQWMNDNFQRWQAHCDVIGWSIYVDTPADAVLITTYFGRDDRAE